MNRRLLLGALATALAIAVSGCGASADHAALTSTRSSARAPLPTKVLVVIEENHSLRQMRAQMPYLAGLSNKYGYATDWKALTHPSEPNYLGILGGSTFGVTGDGPPAQNASKVGTSASVLSQARRAGKSVATYAESMPHPCYLTNSGNYAVRHNPWTYFAADRKSCRAHDLGLPAFTRAAAANHLPKVSLLIPNLVHDAHDASLARADAWLKDQLGPVLRSKDFTSGRLVVIVTADEDDRHSGNTVLTSVLSTRLHHKVATRALNHYSLTRFIDQVLRLKPLRNGRTAPDLVAAFGL